MSSGSAITQRAEVLLSSCFFVFSATAPHPTNHPSIHPIIQMTNIYNFSLSDVRYLIIQSFSLVASKSVSLSVYQ